MINLILQKLIVSGFILTTSLTGIQAAQPLQQEVKAEVVKQVTPQSYIVEMANKHGVNEQLGLDLGWYESRFDPLAKNPNTTAKGIYQWLDGSWKVICNKKYGFTKVYDFKENIECTMKELSKGNIKPWTADLNVRKFLIDKGYVECGEGRNNCWLLENQSLSGKTSSK